jgi:hypothetical protein
VRDGLVLVAESIAVVTAGLEQRRTDTAMDSNLQQVLDFLNRNKLRATYRDVAGVLSVSTQSLSTLIGPRRPEASWVVNDETGKPSGYSEPECHPDLRVNDIIADEDDLRTRMNVEKRNTPVRPPRARRR